MNKKRLAQIRKISGDLNAQREELDSIRGEEEEARDNIPESLQEGDAYQRADEAVDSLENAISSLDEAISSLDDIV